MPAHLPNSIRTVLLTAFACVALVLSPAASTASPVSAHAASATPAVPVARIASGGPVAHVASHRKRHRSHRRHHRAAAHRACHRRHRHCRRSRRHVARHAARQAHRRAAAEVASRHRKREKTTTTESTSGSGSSSGSSTPSLTGAPTSGWSGFGFGNWPLAAWAPYAASSPFNLTVAGASVHPQSEAMVSRVLQWGGPGNVVLGVTGTSEDYGHPVYYAQPGDPIYTLHATEPWGKNALEGMQIPIPASAQAAAGSDGHMAVVTPDGWEYDFWQVQSKPSGGGTMSFSWGGRTPVTGSGLGGDATAANFGLMAGILRPQELEAGVINHALFLVLRCTSNSLEYGFGVQPAPTGDSGGSFVYPAGKGGARCSGESEADVPPMGSWFSLAMSDEQIAAMAVPAWKKAILRALAHYGGFVGDTGGPGFAVQIESGASYTSAGLPDPWVAFAQKNGLPQWNGHYVLNLSQGVEWQRYLRVLTPPAA